MRIEFALTLVASCCTVEPPHDQGPVAGLKLSPDQSSSPMQPPCKICATKTRQQRQLRTTESSSAGAEEAGEWHRQLRIRTAAVSVPAPMPPAASVHMAAWPCRGAQGDPLVPRDAHQVRHRCLGAPGRPQRGCGGLAYQPGWAGCTACALVPVLLALMWGPPLRGNLVLTL